MSNSNEALEILELTLIPGSSPPVYAVGLVASRITFADQQRRAINIIWALLRERRIRPGDELAVIGAGVAGTTAAVFANQQGLRVTVFESYGDAFSIQQGSGRWIHPNIYDWPKDGWRDKQTSLPCMNWHAGPTVKVIAELRSQWEQTLKKSGLRWMPGTTVAEFLRDTGAKGLVRDGSGKTHGPFQCIVLAAGFGEEPEKQEIDGKPYWRDDDLHQRIRTGGTALVSGCGDGGLIDAARIVFRDFQHDWLPEVASMASSDEDLVRKLIHLEHDTPNYRDGAALTQATLDVAPKNNILSQIRDRLKPGTNVILNGRLDGPLTRGACMLNRFIIGQLIILGVVNYQKGFLDPASVRSKGKKFEYSIDGSGFEADLIVLRHGPAKRPLEKFPELDASLKPVRDFLKTYSAGVDRTRRRFWTQLPDETLPTTDPLPPLTLGSLNYLGRSARDAIQQELIRLSKLATVAYECVNQCLHVRVHEKTKTHTLLITLSPEASLSITCKRSSGEQNVQIIPLSAKATDDAKGAANTLNASIPNLIEWLMEEST